MGAIPPPLPRPLRPDYVCSDEEPEYTAEQKWTAAAILVVIALSFAISVQWFGPVGLFIPIGIAVALAWCLWNLTLIGVATWQEERGRRK